MSSSLSSLVLLFHRAHPRPLLHPVPNSCLHLLVSSYFSCRAVGFTFGMVNLVNSAFFTAAAADVLLLVSDPPAFMPWKLPLGILARDTEPFVLCVVSDRTGSIRTLDKAAAWRIVADTSPDFVIEKVGPPWACVRRPPRPPCPTGTGTRPIHPPCYDHASLLDHFFVWLPVPTLTPALGLPLPALLSTPPPTRPSRSGTCS